MEAVEDVQIVLQGGVEQRLGVLGPLWVFVCPPRTGKAHVSGAPNVVLDGIVNRRLGGKGEREDPVVAEQLAVPRHAALVGGEDVVEIRGDALEHLEVRRVFLVPEHSRHALLGAPGEQGAQRAVGLVRVLGHQVLPVAAVATPRRFGEQERGLVLLHLLAPALAGEAKEVGLVLQALVGEGVENRGDRQLLGCRRHRRLPGWIGHLLRFSRRRLVGSWRLAADGVAHLGDDVARRGGRLGTNAAAADLSSDRDVQGLQASHHRRGGERPRRFRRHRWRRRRFGRRRRHGGGRLGSQSRDQLVQRGGTPREPFRLPSGPLLAIHRSLEAIGPILQRLVVAPLLAQEGLLRVSKERLEVDLECLRR